jgi:hypothetical protein
MSQAVDVACRAILRRVRDQSPVIAILLPNEGVVVPIGGANRELRAHLLDLLLELHAPDFHCVVQHIEGGVWRCHGKARGAAVVTWERAPDGTLQRIQPSPRFAWIDIDAPYESAVTTIDMEDDP